ncbi:MAG: FG-GAP-like repeat-containing protein [Caldilineaceae bacterium]
MWHSLERFYDRRNLAYGRGALAFAAALLLAGLFVTGLAAAADQPQPIAASAGQGLSVVASQPATATQALTDTQILTTGQAPTPGQPLLLDVPIPTGLPATGRPVTSVDVPEWVADLLIRGGARGVTDGEVVVWKNVSDGLAPDGQAINGNLITYAISVTNNTTATIRNVSLLDVLPRGALQEPIECIPNVACQKIIEAQEIPEPLGGTILVTETRQISWTIASIAPGTSAVRRFSGRLVGQTDGSVLKNQAFATYQQGNEQRAASSNETQTIVKVDALVGAGATLARAATWFSSDRGGTLSLDWGDFDRDGDLDLALGSSVGTAIYRNDNGRLHFFWSNGRRTFGVAWGDFLGDGLLDLVAVGDESDGVGLSYLYTIQGTAIQESSRFTSTYPFVRAAPGDYDKDGDLDLVLSTNAINAACPVQFFRNTGGAFSRLPDADGGCVSQRATAAVVPGDVDNDGDLDLALGLFPNSVQLFVNDGSGKFPASLHRNVDTSASFLPYDFVWGDYDGDGYLDLAAAYPLMRQARIYHNVGGTSFSTAFTLRTDRFLTPFSLDWGDFTGDGKLDLAVANVSPLVFEQTSTGFVRQPQLSADGVRGQIWSLRGVDLDQDGDLDLSVTNRDGPSLVFTNFAPLLKTALTPVPATSVITGSRATAPSAGVAWGDLNNDGMLDLVFAAGPASAGPIALATKIYYNTRGVFSRNDEVNLGGFGPHTLAVGDANNDNALDLAVGTAQGTSVYLAGALGVAAWTSGPPFLDVSALAWGDYDDDEDLDLLVANRNGPVQLYRNLTEEGTGLLTNAPVWTSESGNSRAVAWADLNGDSYLDFVVGQDGQANRIYLNQRNVDANLTSFVPMNWPVAPANTWAVAWGDYDGDGDQDLAVGNYGQSNQIYENRGIFKGVPIFSSAPVWVSTETSKTTSLAWGDWDGDGDLDLAVGNDGEADQVYVNRRDPSIPTSSVQLAWLWSSSTAQRTTGVAWGDVDNDGDLDLATSQAGGGTSIDGYYENTTIVAAHLLDEYRAAIPLTINPAYLKVSRPGRMGGGGDYALPGILSGPAHPTVTVPFRLYDPDGIRNKPGSNGFGTPIPVSRLIYEYSLDDGGHWLRATGELSKTGTSTQQPVTLGPSRGNADLNVSLVAGTTKFSIKHDGQALFTVWLRDTSGNLSVLLAEKTGAFDGEKEVIIPANGTYSIQIRADGEWSISVAASAGSSDSTAADSVVPTRLGQEYAFVWNAQADAAISENARFRISLIQSDNVGPVQQGSISAVSPPFRVRGTSCVWPRGLSFRVSKSSPNPQEVVAYTGLLTEGTGVMTFTWDFGDGSDPISGQRINHTYLYGGTYNVRITATGVACPIGRSITITGMVKVGTGVAPLFLPIIANRTGALAASASALVSPPGPVGKFSGETEGDNLRLVWAAPTTGGPVNGYRVYASRGGGPFQPVAVTSGERTDFQLTGQSCGAAWLVTAVGPGGEGPDSLQSYLSPPCGGQGGGQ